MISEQQHKAHLNLRTTQRRIILLRWCLLAAVASAVSSAPTFLAIALPLLPMFAVIMLVAAFNAYLQWHNLSAANTAVGTGELFAQLCVDLTALAILLYLSGGAANPLISILLVPVAVAALSLPGRLTAAFALLAVVIYSVLMWQFLPLQVHDAERATRLHLSGMWLTFVLSVSMITWFVARMTASIAARDRQLAVAREQSLRDERVVALGALAAGAAHELGTPLATMAVVIGELEREAFQSIEVQADLALVREQIGICKSIISNMVERAGGARPEQVQAQDAVRWVQAVRTRWQTMRPRAASTLSIEGIRGAPLILTDTTLEQGLTNLLNNAADAGTTEIDINIGWDQVKVWISIIDHGPGFAEDVLNHAGLEPMISSSGGSGIGLLLAGSAVERLGGRMELRNLETGGGCAMIELPISQQRQTGPE
jgi:two-component system sensor histidine kinase RegB